MVGGDGNDKAYGGNTQTGAGYLQYLHGDYGDAIRSSTNPTYGYEYHPDTREMGGNDQLWGGDDLMYG